MMLLLRSLTPLISLLVFLGNTSSALAETSGLQKQHSSFADDLTAALYEDENECTSMLGISMAFGLIYPSASGEALEQMESVLRYPSTSSSSSTHRQLVWNETATRLDTKYQGLCVGGDDEFCPEYQPILEIANSVWMDDEFNLDPDYSVVVDEFVRQIDFEADTAGGIVNSWVNGSTNGLIDSIVDEGPLYPPLILLAVNSIYLKASWTHQFMESLTNTDVFYTDATRGTSKADRAQFMHQVESFGYSHEAVPGYQIVKMPLAGGDLSVIIVLPLTAPTTGAENGGGMLSSTALLSALPSLKSTRLALAFPKFRFESKYKERLKNALKAIGLKAPFAGGLCVREGSCGAFIDFVIQKTFIDVNELGVEAAAVTAIGVRESGATEEPEPILVQADHPFQFFIYDDEEEIMIFGGRVGNPEVADGSPSAQLQKKHSESDFWMSIFNVEPDEIVVLPDKDSSSLRSVSTLLVFGVIVSTLVVALS